MCADGSDSRKAWGDYGFLTVSSDISRQGGFRPDDPEATTEMSLDIAAYLDFERSPVWRGYYERNATFPVSALLFYDSRRSPPESREAVKVDGSRCASRRPT